MSDTSKLPAVNVLLESFAHVRRSEIDPSHHTDDLAMTARQIKQESRFLLRLICLHRDTTVDVVYAHLPDEILGYEIAPDRRHVLGDPGIAKRIKLPEMLMRIDSHAINSTNIEETTVDWVIHAGDESRFIGTEIQRQRCHFTRFCHPADRLCVRHPLDHLFSPPGIILFDKARHERREHARRRYAIAADVVADVVARD